MAPGHLRVLRTPRAATARLGLPLRRGGAVLRVPLRLGFLALHLGLVSPGGGLPALLVLADPAEAFDLALGSTALALVGELFAAIGNLLARVGVSVAIAGDPVARGRRRLAQAQTRLSLEQLRFAHLEFDLADLDFDPCVSASASRSSTAAAAAKGR